MLSTCTLKSLVAKSFRVLSISFKHVNRGGFKGKVVVGVVKSTTHPLHKYLSNHSFAPSYTVPTNIKTKHLQQHGKTL